MILAAVFCLTACPQPANPDPDPTPAPETPVPTEEYIAIDADFDLTALYSTEWMTITETISDEADANVSSEMIQALKLSFNDDATDASLSMMTVMTLVKNDGGSFTEDEISTYSASINSTLEQFPEGTTLDKNTTDNTKLVFTFTMNMGNFSTQLAGSGMTFRDVLNFCYIDSSKTKLKFFNGLDENDNIEYAIYTKM